MNKRFLDVLTFVINEIRDQSEGDIDLQAVFDILEDEGFTQDEITTAMSWIMSHGENLDRITTSHAAPFSRPMWRSLNDVEREAISPDAFSYLFRLRELNLVTDDIMENIIDRAVSLRLYQMNVEEMMDLIAAVVLNFEDSAAKGYFQFTATHFPH
ncbi:MAG: DUF494 family protein [Calditrichaeota bacterium]|nr:MAG: DUF494 family protein [Calditrichota bacterium]